MCLTGSSVWKVLWLFMVHLKGLYSVFPGVCRSL